MSIIILIQSHFGDFLLTCDIIDRLIVANPKIEIYLYMKDERLLPKVEDIVTLYKDNIKVIRIIQTKSKTVSGLSKLRKYISTISGIYADFKQIIQLQANVNVFSITSLGCVKRIYRFVLFLPLFLTQKSYRMNFISFFTKTPTDLNTAAINAISSAFEFDFNVKSSEKLKHFVKQNYDQSEKILSIAPEASNNYKIWDYINFANVAEYFIKNHDFKVKIFGTNVKSDSIGNKINQELTNRGIKNERVVNMIGKTNNAADYLREISKSSFIISSDSAGYHVANMLDIPVAVLWSVRRFHYTAIYYIKEGSKILNIFPDNNSPCCSKKHKMFYSKIRRCKKCDKANVNSITSDKMIKAIEDYLLVS